MTPSSKNRSTAQHPFPTSTSSIAGFFASGGVLKAQAGWLEVKIGDVKGGQYIGRLAGEYITERRWGFGAAINFSNVDVDWDNIGASVEEGLLRAKIDLDINDFSLYFRVRW